MAQDRIRYMADRLREGAAIADVLEAARSVVEQYEIGGNDLAKVHPEQMWRLQHAVGDLWSAGYIELPDS